MVMAPSFVIKQDLHHLNRGCTGPVSCLPAKIVEKPDALHRVGKAYLSDAPSQPGWNRVFDFFHIQVMWPQVSLADAHRHTAASTVSGRRCSLSICLRSHLDVLRAQLERQPVRPLHSDLLFSWGWQESWQKKGKLTRGQASSVMKHQSQRAGARERYVFFFKSVETSDHLLRFRSVVRGNFIPQKVHELVCIREEAC